MNSRFKNIVTYWAIAVVVFLFNVFFLVFKGLYNTVHYVQNHFELVIFLDTEVSADEIQKLKDVISSIPELDEFIFTSGDEAWKEFIVDNNWAVLMDEIEKNPLPGSFRIRLKDVTVPNMEKTAELVRSLKGVRDVIYESDGINSLNRIERILHVMETSLAVILGLFILSSVAPLLRIAYLSGAEFPYNGFMNGLLGGSIGIILSLAAYAVCRKFFGSFVVLPAIKWGLVFFGGMILGFAGGATDL